MGIREQECIRSNDQGGFIRISCDFARLDSQATPTTTKEKELACGKSCYFLLKLQTRSGFERLLT